MHEHINSRTFRDRKNTKSLLRQVRISAVNRLRQRIFRTTYLAAFVTSIALVCCLHSHFVHAEVSALKSSAPTNTDAAIVTSTPITLDIKVAVLKPAPDPSANAVYDMDEKRHSAIPFKKTIHLSQDEPVGQARVSNPGSNGTLEQTYRVTYKGNNPIKFRLLSSTVVKQPQNMEVMAGYTDREARAMPSRSGLYTRTREIDMLATGYSPYEGSGSGRTANGMHAGFGVVAVDPRLIPLGSKLYIDGYGYALAGDTGGAIRGHRIDLGLNSYRAANRIGRQYVHVYVLSEGR